MVLLSVRADRGCLSRDALPAARAHLGATSHDGLHGGCRGRASVASSLDRWYRGGFLAARSVGENTSRRALTAVAATTDPGARAAYTTTTRGLLSDKPTSDGLVLADSKIKMLTL